MKFDIVAVGAKKLAESSVGRFAYKNAGRILLGGSIVGSIASTGFAVRAGMKTGDILAAHHSEKEVDKKAADKKATKELVKVYLPVVAAEVTAISCGIASHQVEHSRLVAMTAYANMVSASFAEYRARVVEKDGSEADAKYLFGTETDHILEETITKGGKKKTAEREIDILKRPDGMTIFARCYDEFNSGTAFDRSDPWANVVRVRQTEDMLNRMLVSGGADHGHAWLTEAYKQFDFSLEGCGYIAMMGWMASDYIDTDGLVMEHPIHIMMYDRYGNEITNDTDLVPGEGIWLDFPGAGAIWDRI